MRISDLIRRQLLKNGYHYAKSTREEFSLFYRYEGKKVYLVHLVEVDNHFVYDASRLQDTIRQAEVIFKQKGYFQTESFVLAVTDCLIKARELCYGNDASWIINAQENRLLIYENQPGDFFGIRNIVEEALRKNKNYGMKDTVFDFINTIGQVTMLMVLINILVFIILSYRGSTLDAGFMSNHGAMLPEAIYNGNWYQIISSMFLHFGIQHLASNMLVLCLLGSMLERNVGKISFFFIYMLSGIGGNIISALHSLYSKQVVVSAGASGAVFGVMGALVCIVIMNKGRLENLTTKKMLIFAGLSLYQGFSSQGVDNFAHVGGVITGVIVAFVCVMIRKGSRKLMNERYKV